MTFPFFLGVALANIIYVLISYHVISVFISRKFPAMKRKKLVTFIFTIPFILIHSIFNWDNGLTLSTEIFDLILISVFYFIRRGKKTVTTASIATTDQQQEKVDL